MATNESLARHKLLATDERNIPPGAEVTPTEPETTQPETTQPETE